MSRIGDLLRWLAEKVEPILRNATFRLFVRDAIEAFLVAWPALAIGFPNSVADLKSSALAIVVAIGAAFIAAGRRVITPWLLDHVFGSAA